MCQTCRMRMKSPPLEFTRYQQPLSFYLLPFPVPPPVFLLSLSLSVYYYSSIKEQWSTERPPNRRDIPTISREKGGGERGRGGILAEVWKPSITEGLKLTSQQDVCIRMQIRAGYGQQMPSGAVKRAATAQERPYAVWDSGLLTGDSAEEWKIKLSDDGSGGSKESL